MSLFVSYKKLSDEALMKRLQNQDIKAFDYLYERYYTRLYGFVLKMNHYDKMSSDDIIQDLFIKLFQHPEKFDITKKFTSWVYTVAANECKKQFRIRSLASLEGKDFLAETEVTLNGNELTQFTLKLDKQLKEVGEKHREVFILRYQADLSLQEIAEIQDCALGTVKSRLHYTTKFLAEKLTPYKSLLLENELTAR